MSTPTNTASALADALRDALPYVAKLNGSIHARLKAVLAQHEAQQPHYVEKVEPINGGMGPNFDEVRLKTGHVLQISDEGITVWPNEAAYQGADNANVLAGVSFDFPNNVQQPKQHLCPDGFPCDSCDWTFDCFSGVGKCRKAVKAIADAQQRE